MARVSDDVSSRLSTNGQSELASLKELEGYRHLRASAQGGFARVWSVSRPPGKPGPQRVALKVTQLISEQASTVVDREIQYLKAMSHDNVVRLLRDFKDEAKKLHVLELEYVDHVNFTNMCNLSIYGVAQYMYQILNALDYCHGRALVHADIKASNFLFDISTGKGKLIDFGLSCSITSRRQVERHVSGTPGYRPPEALFLAQLCPKRDIWGVGILFLSLLTGSPKGSSIAGMARRVGRATTYTDLMELLELCALLGWWRMDALLSSLHQSAGLALDAANSTNQVPVSDTSEPLFPGISVHELVCKRRAAWYGSAVPFKLPREALDLLCQLLEVHPNQRCSAKQAKEHAFFTRFTNNGARTSESLVVTRPLKRAATMASDWSSFKVPKLSENKERHVRDDHCAHYSASLLPDAVKRDKNVQQLMKMSLGRCPVVAIFAPPKRETPCYTFELPFLHPVTAELKWLSAASRRDARLSDSLIKAVSTPNGVKDIDWDRVFAPESDPGSGAVEHVPESPAAPTPAKTSPVVKVSPSHRQPAATRVERVAVATKTSSKAKVSKATKKKAVPVRKVMSKPVGMARRDPVAVAPPPKTLVYKFPVEQKKVATADSKSMLEVWNSPDQLPLATLKLTLDVDSEHDAHLWLGDSSGKGFMFVFGGWRNTRSGIRKGKSDTADLKVTHFHPFFPQGGGKATVFVSVVRENDGSMVLGFGPRIERELWVYYRDRSRLALTSISVGTWYGASASWTLFIEGSVQVPTDHELSKRATAHPVVRANSLQVQPSAFTGVKTRRGLREEAQLTPRKLRKANRTSLAPRDSVKRPLPPKTPSGKLHRGSTSKTTRKGRISDGHLVARPQEQPVGEVAVQPATPNLVPDQGDPPVEPESPGPPNTAVKKGTRAVHSTVRTTGPVSTPVASRRSSDRPLRTSPRLAKARRLLTDLARVGGPEVADTAAAESADKVISRFVS
mmetsp:Transcript_91178/g.244129  ORF Transcript_91178/g.244129 Transcript_91178/m.244129 type:complete len:962 (-) Transcript_91178:321-3206(-)